MASSALPASATTSNPSSASSSRRSPLRTTAWSSARTIVIGSPIGPERNYADECGALRMPPRAARRILDAMSSRVVIAGGGVAALEALLALRADAGPLIDVTLVANTDVFAYRALQLGDGNPSRYQLASLVE